MATLVLLDLGRTDYQATLDRMRRFTATRDAHTPDALWLTEHPAVFTQGQAGDPAHVLAAGAIPVVQTDRGGQVTYHGPGQIVAYVLFDIARRRVGVRALVRLLESAVIDVLAAHGINGAGRIDAPGVYVGDAKIASIGLRVRQGRTYHGLAFNARMDLEPFGRINPCGYPGLTVTDAQQLGIGASIETLKQELASRLTQRWTATTQVHAAADAAQERAGMATAAADPATT